jgi:hypothetical protein
MQIDRYLLIGSPRTIYDRPEHGSTEMRAILHFFCKKAIGCGAERILHALALISREIHIRERMISEVMTSFADSVAD